jgi:hypothetical protein
MDPRLFVFPMSAMAALTFSVLVRLFRARVRAITSGEVDSAYFRTYQNGVEPASSAKLARHFTNLFEAPVLFYVACLAAMVVNQVSVVLLALAWLYVFARAVHTFVHTGSNRLRQRVNAYFFSWLVLLAFWIVLVVNIVAAG